MRVPLPEASARSTKPAPRPTPQPSVAGGNMSLTVTEAQARARSHVALPHEDAGWRQGGDGGPIVTYDRASDASGSSASLLDSDEDPDDELTV